MTSFEHWSDNFVFVSGHPRGGTTLLKLVLSAHPDITIASETGIMDVLFPRFYNGNKRLTLQDAKTVLEYVQKDDKIKRWKNFDINQFIARADLYENKPLAFLLEQLWRASNSEGKKANLVGTKKGTFASERGLYIAKEFLDAKFIYIIRDPRDVIISIKNNLHPEYSIRKGVAIYIERINVIERMQKKFPKRVYVLRYEDLVKRPEEKTRAICDFLNVSYADQMLLFHTSNENFSNVLEGSEEIHKQTVMPIHSNSTSSWEERGLSRKNAEYILSVAWKEAQTYKYEEHPKKTLRGWFVRRTIIIRIWIRRAMLLMRWALRGLI
jgi:hypothetical protein